VISQTFTPFFMLFCPNTLTTSFFCKLGQEKSSKKYLVHYLHAIIVFPIQLKQSTDTLELCRTAIQLARKYKCYNHKKTMFIILNIAAYSVSTTNVFDKTMNKAKNKVC
jgi:hypothetical protein